MRKSIIIIVSVAAAAVVLTLVGVLIWWLVTDSDVYNRYETIVLEGEGFGDVPHKAAFTKIPDSGNIFWWFYPTLAESATTKPIVLWLDGVTGLPPSLLANFGMFGPFDFSFNRRNNSWIDDYNLLFMDGPIGSGFSTIADGGEIPKTLEGNIKHLILALESFYGQNSEFYETPLYICGQGYGGQLAVALALQLTDAENFSPNLKGLILGNAIISPAIVLTKLGYYLEEFAYIDFNGRNAIENLSDEITGLVNQDQLKAAYDRFLTLDKFINENAGAVAVNLHHITEKLTQEASGISDDFGQTEKLRTATGFEIIYKQFMNEIVAPALGIPNPDFDRNRTDVLQGFQDFYMTPATEKVEKILNSTNIKVAIYNGNLDAVSNTPGQLQWINSLRWNGQEEFLSSPRETLVINNLIEGYFRQTDRLTFYWINVAGHSAPLDNPIAVRTAIQTIMDH